MVVDALLAAEPALRLAERAHDPAAFCRMDDGVLDFIENVDLLSPAVSVDAGAEAALAEAQAIVSRLRRRQLYRYVTDAPVPAEPRERGRWAAPSAEDVVACYGGAAVRLDPADVIVQEIKIGELCCAGIIFADCQQFADLPAPPPAPPLALAQTTRCATPTRSTTSTSTTTSTRPRSASCGRVRSRRW
jgi:hypothetical protein